MYRYRQITYEEHVKTPYSDTIDTFNHLPQCPSRILPPLRLKMPKLGTKFQLHGASKTIKSDNEVITWFFTVVNYACTEFSTVFQLEYFTQKSAEGDCYLVTAALNDYRAAWMESSKNIPLDSLIEISLELYNLTHSYNIMADTASEEAQILFALVGEYFEKIYRRMIHDTVRQVTQDNPDSPGFDLVPTQLRLGNNWESSVWKIVAARFLDSGKCLYTYSRISDLFGLSSAFYMSQLDCPDHHQDISSCSLDECFGHNIDPQTHAMVHTSMGCQCPIFEADMETIGKILETPDLIPIMVFDRGSLLKVRVVPHTEVKEYITISYSASQLFASPSSNSMPTCQLKAIKQVVQRCMRDWDKDGELRGVWIDTLHVPVPQIKTKYREQALMKMSKTFEESRIVLAIDPNLARRAATDFVPEEFMSYLHCSPWFTRLWTFSESLLAKNLWVWYSGRALSVDSFLKNQNWPPIGHSWRRYDELEGIGRLRLMSRRETVPPISAEERRTQCQSHEYFDIVMEGLRHRQTSQASDEPFCLSLIMQLDTAKILDVPKERQMEAFYSQLQNISGVLLIQSGERLTTPGFRWAPKTLLGRKAVSRYGHDEDYTVRIDGFGVKVPVTYPAFKLTVIKSKASNRVSDELSPSHVVFFRMSMQDLYPKTGTVQSRSKSDHRILSLTIPVDPSNPFVRKTKPFLLPGDQFVVVVRGLAGDGSHMPCMVLKLESQPTSDQVLPELEHLIGAKNRLRMMTSYYRFGFITLRSKEDTQKVQKKLNLSSAFKGETPRTEERMVCNAEGINLEQCDIWVS